MVAPTILSRQSNATPPAPVVADLAYGSIVSTWIADSAVMTLTADQTANLAKLRASESGASYIVKYHMDYTKVLEDAIKHTVYDLASSVFFYSGSVDLRTDVASLNASDLQQAGTGVWNVRELLVTKGGVKGLDTGAYYRITCAPDGDGALLSAILISPKDDFSGSVKVDSGDAVVINKDGGFDLIDNAEATLTSSNADIHLTPGLLQGHYDLTIDPAGAFGADVTSRFTQAATAANAHADAQDVIYHDALIAYANTKDAEFDAAADARETAKDAAIQANVDAEVARATAAESALTASISAENVRAVAAEGVLSADLAAEVSRATAADTTHAADIAAEITRATTAELSLRSDLTSEVGRATAAESSLSTALATESARALAAEGVLTSDLTAEIARAQAAEAAIQAEVDTEETRAFGVETGLRTDLDNEIAARIAADAVSSTAVSNEAARALAAEGVLTASVSTLASNVGRSMETTAQRLKILEQFVYVTEQFIQVSQDGSSVMDFSNTLGAIGWPANAAVDVTAVDAVTAAPSMSATSNAFADAANPVVYTFA